MKWFLLLSIVGCAQVTSLNLKKHQFGLVPTKIIWFQISGLEEEQIAMIRFQETSEKRTSFENNICFGQTWNYNLYQLRNSAEATFLSQITGTKNIKGSCEDASLRPIWSYMLTSGFSTAIIESGAIGSQSLLGYKKCGKEGEDFLNSLYYFSRTRPIEGAETFHYAENFEIKPDKVMYDRTCGDSTCGSSLTDDFKAIYEKFNKVSLKHLLIVRDFSYLQALLKKDFAGARQILVDIERAYGDALKLVDSSDYLVILTSGDSKFIDMPNQGKDFFEFDKDLKNISIKRSKLTNMVLASGSRAENFCGIYEDSEVFERILSGPKQQGLELKIINPFK